MPSAIALSITDLEVTLGGRQILQDISLEAEQGAITALLGPNGAGKSTLLRAIVGVPAWQRNTRSGATQRGEIALHGEPASELSRAQRARRVAYLPQRSALDAPLAVATVVEHGRYAHVRSRTLRARDHRAVAEALEATDTTNLADRRYSQLSGGERRRVLLARALATGARILLLDEPAASLDVGHALALHALLHDLASRGYCIVVALHDLNDVLDHADRAVLLDRGSVVASGPPVRVLANDLVTRVYGVEITRQERVCFRLPESAT